MGRTDININHTAKHTDVRTEHVDLRRQSLGSNKSCRIGRVHGEAVLRVQKEEGEVPPRPGESSVLISAWGGAV